jgi:uncharacterized protein YnzC (UPF0291/DUF896 family)
MDNPRSDLSTQSNIPEKWREKFLIKRIGENDIEITLEERNAILEMLARGMRYVQIGKYTIMLNSIKSIDPKWGKDNIPPRPEIKVFKDIKGVNEKGNYMMNEKIDDTEQKEWDLYFAVKNSLIIK